MVLPQHLSEVEVRTLTRTLRRLDSSLLNHSVCLCCFVWRHSSLVIPLLAMFYGGLESQVTKFVYTNKPLKDYHPATSGRLAM